MCHACHWLCAHFAPGTPNMAQCHGSAWHECSGHCHSPHGETFQIIKRSRRALGGQAMAWCLYKAYRDKECDFLAKAIGSAWNRCHTMLKSEGPCLVCPTRLCRPCLACPKDWFIGPSTRRSKKAVHVGVGQGLRIVQAQCNFNSLHCCNGPCLARPTAPAKKLVGLARPRHSVPKRSEVFVADGTAELAGRPGCSGSERPACAAASSTPPPLAASAAIHQGVVASPDLVQGQSGKTRPTLPSSPDVWQKLQVKLGQENQVLENVGYAEQRFDSFSKPLRRMLTHCLVSVYTAHIIIRERNKNTRERQTSTHALKALDVESMLQLDLLADACACADPFTCFLDEDTFGSVRPTN